MFFKFPDFSFSYAIHSTIVTQPVYSPANARCSSAIPTNSLEPTLANESNVTGHVHPKDSPPTSFPPCCFTMNFHPKSNSTPLMMFTPVTYICMPPILSPFHCYYCTIARNQVKYTRFACWFVHVDMISYLSLRHGQPTLPLTGAFL